MGNEDFRAHDELADRGIPESDFVSRSIPLGHTGPEIDGFRRETSQRDGGVTTVYTSLNAQVRDVYGDMEY